MKWIILILVLANVAFFAWKYPQTPVSQQAPPRDEGAPSLLLLSEAPPASTSTGEDAGPAVLQSRSGLADPQGELLLPEQPEEARTGPAEPAPAPVAEGETQAAAAQPPLAGASSEPSEPQAQRSEAEVQTGMSAPAEQPPEPAPQEQPPEPAPPEQTPAPVPEPAPPPELVCYRLGPFAEDEPVDALLAWLRERGARVESRWSEQREPRSYWVYLPPFPSVEEARRMLRQLRDDGVSDFIRVMKGPNVNAISLGLFSQRRSADNRLDYLRAKGYAPELEVRYDVRRERWIVAVMPEPEAIAQGALLAEFPDLSLEQAACP